MSESEFTSDFLVEAAQLAARRGEKVFKVGSKTCSPKYVVAGDYRMAMVRLLGANGLSIQPMTDAAVRKAVGEEIMPKKAAGAVADGKKTA